MCKKVFLIQSVKDKGFLGPDVQIAGRAKTGQKHDLQNEKVGGNVFIT